MKTQIIQFDEQDERYSSFCIDAPYGVNLDGRTWPTVHHYLLGRKYPGLTSQRVFWNRPPDRVQQVIRRAADFDPRWAVVHPKWPVFRDEWLLTALAARTSQHLDLERLLFDTGDVELVYRPSGHKSAWLGRDSDGHGHNMLGRLLMRARRSIGKSPLYQPSRTDLKYLERVERAARRKSGNTRKLVVLGRHYFELNWFERARAVFRAVVRTDPDDWVGYYWLALTHIKLGEDEQAVEPLKWLIRDDPEDTDFYRLMSDVCFRLGRPVQARVYAVRADRIDNPPESRM